MKRIWFFMMIILAFTSGVRAEGVSGGASVDVMSNYVWRGFKLSDGVVIQSSLGMTHGSFGANMWVNYDTDLNEHNETDLTLSYSSSVERFSLEAGYIYYALDGMDDTQEIYLSVGYDTLFSPTVAIYYDIDEGNGLFIAVSIGHHMTLTRDITLGLSASVSYNMESEYSIGDFSGFHNAELSASAGIPVSKGVTIGPLITYSFPLSDDAEDAIEAVSYDSDSHIFYGGIGVALEF